MHKLSLSIGLAALLFTACGGSANKSGQTTAPTDTAQNTDASQNTAAADVVFPEEEFRKSQPAAGEPRAFNLPGIQTFKLGGNIDVYLVENHDLPTISVQLELDGGSVSDRKGREGTARVCMSLMSEGTKSLDKLAFAEALADTASSISSYAGIESQSFSMRTLSKNFDATFALFADTILAPGLRDEDLKRQVKRSLESLKQIKGSPGSVGRRLSKGIIYGEKHPMGRISTEKSLSKIKIADCKSYHKSYIKPKGARLFIVGDLTRAQIEEKFAPLLTKWKGSPKKIAKMPKPQTRKGKVFFVDIPGSAQSSIGLSHFGPGRKDEGYFANQLMAGVLGRGFSSRINMNLREDKGYSYGARGGFNYNRHYGLFAAGSSVKSNTTRQSIDEIISEIRALKDQSKPALAKELAREKNGAILSLPASFATAGQVLSMYRTLQYYGLPADYYNNYVANVSKVDLAQVNAAAGKTLNPDELVILVVGDGKTPQIMRDGDKDMPRLAADGKTPVTLFDSLVDLAGGKKNLVVLDADGNVKK